ncbi:RNA polymerase sigma factor [Flavitalea flava]
MYGSLTSDEQALLQQLQAGNPCAFTQLYHVYSGQLYVNIFKMVKDEQITEEIVQDIFTCIWQKRTELQFDQSFGAYLYRMAQNRVVDFYRKLTRDKSLYEKFKALTTAHYSHIEEALHVKENEALLRQAIASLPSQQKKVFQLCKRDGWSYKEAGEQLGISQNTVKEHLVKANVTIRHFLQGRFAGGLGLLLLFIFRRPS